LPYSFGGGVTESIVYKQPKIAQIAPEMRFSPSFWWGNTESIRTAFIPSLKEGDFPPIKLKL
jgi:predicted alpha/beta superfamily hydrolase